MPPTTSIPCASSFLAISGLLSALLISSFMRLRISGGVLAGARIAHQAGASKPAKPLSAMVGTSGRSGERLLVVTARGRMRLLSMCGLVTNTEAIDSGTWPATASVIKGPPPL